MKIVILGAGQVGASVAENLVSEDNDITVVDVDVPRLAALQDRFDLRTVYGNAASPTVLRDAGAQDADLLLAVTQSDQTNLCACRIAKTVFNIPRRVARLRASDFTEFPELLNDDNFAVDYPICPEQIVTDHLARLIEFPEALQVLDFANGRITLIAVRAGEGSPLIGHPVRDLRRNLSGVDARIAAIFRRERAIMPRGDTVIEIDDEVFCIADTEHIRDVMHQLHRSEKRARRIMIAGGGNIGFRLAKQIEHHYEVKIIEPLQARAEFLAINLDNSLVLKGGGTDEKLLEIENIDDMDMFLALTNDDENNIMASSLAKRLGAGRVLALINRRSYVDLVQSGPIDIAISPAQVSIGALLAHVRRGDVAVVHSLRRGAAEALELVAHGDPRSSAVCGKRIAEIKLPEGVTIAALVRNREVAPVDSTHPRARVERDYEVLMAHHDTVIQPDDHVIVFCTSRSLVPAVEELFQVKPGFL